MGQKNHQIFLILISKYWILEVVVEFPVMEGWIVMMARMRENAVDLRSLDVDPENASQSQRSAMEREIARTGRMNTQSVVSFSKKERMLTLQ